MKKFLSMSLVVVLVLALGAVAFAVEGTLAEEGTLSDEIEVHAKIGPYAQVMGRRAVNFGTLLGKVGVYTANGFDNGDDPDDEFYGRVKGDFGDALFAGNNDSGWGSFAVESNTDVMVRVKFTPNNWGTFPTKFAVAMKGQPTDAIAWFDTVEGEFEHKYASHALTDNKDDFVKTAVLYGIDGAIWLQYISQQEAGSYDGKITITVSKD